MVGRISTNWVVKVHSYWGFFLATSNFLHPSIMVLWTGCEVTLLSTDVRYLWFSVWNCLHEKDCCWFFWGEDLNCLSSEHLETSNKRHLWSGIRFSTGDFTDRAELGTRKVLKDFQCFSFVWLDWEDWIEFRRSIHLYIFVKSCLNLSSNFLVLCVSFARRRLETFECFCLRLLFVNTCQIGINVYFFLIVIVIDENVVSYFVFQHLFDLNLCAELFPLCKISVFLLLFWLDAERDH